MVVERSLNNVSENEDPTVVSYAPEPYKVFIERLVVYYTPDRVSFFKSESD